MGRPKKPTTPEQNVAALARLAAACGVDDNPLFRVTLDQYVMQQRAIALMREALDGADMAVSKEYVKGRENVYAHPLIKELPKHCDSANKTAELLLKIITSLGKKPDDDGFDGFVEGREEL